jgi:hypothetical protein
MPEHRNGHSDVQVVTTPHVANLPCTPTAPAPLILDVNSDENVGRPMRW